MKTIDHIKQHVKEWPEGCTHICVDDDGQIWLHKDDPKSARYECGGWISCWYDSVDVRPEEKLEDNDKIITKEEWDKYNEGLVMKLVSWNAMPNDITIGKCYEINNEGEFLDNIGKVRESYHGQWENCDVAFAKPSAWSMDKFNEELKSLLQEAGKNGIAVNRVEANYYDASTAEGKKFVLADIDVEYKY